MILDGYNETHRVEGGTFVCRPMLRWERAEFSRQTAGIGGELYERLLFAQVESRIVARDWDAPIEAWDDELFRIVWGRAFGHGNDEQEQCDEENLYRGAKLYAAYPHLARVSCEQCKVWWFNPLTGRTAKRAGNPLKRPAGGLLLCQTTEPCPKGTPDDPVQFTPKNLKAYRHYQECGGRVPQDSLCLRNARIIERATKDAIAERDRLHPKTARRSAGRSGTAGEHGRLPASGTGRRTDRRIGAGA